MKYNISESALGMRLKLHVIKRQKKIIFGSVGFAVWFVEFKRYSKFTPKPFLKKIVRKIPN